MNRLTVFAIASVLLDGCFLPSVADMRGDGAVQKARALHEDAAAQHLSQIGEGLSNQDNTTAYDCVLAYVDLREVETANAPSDTLQSRLEYCVRACQEPSNTHAQLQAQYSAACRSHGEHVASQLVGEQWEPVVRALAACEWVEVDRYLGDLKRRIDDGAVGGPLGAELEVKMQEVRSNYRERLRRVRQFGERRDVRRLRGEIQPRTARQLQLENRRMDAENRRMQDCGGFDGDPSACTAARQELEDLASERDRLDREVHDLQNQLNTLERGAGIRGCG